MSKYGIAIHENADVYAIFANGEIIPRAFRINMRTFNIDTVLERWTGEHYKDGVKHTLRYMLVQASVGKFKLMFDAYDCRWVVEEIGGEE